MVYEDTIKYPYYEIEIDIPDDEDNQEAKALIGDVAFEVCAPSSCDVSRSCMC